MVVASDVVRLIYDRTTGLSSIFRRVPEAEQRVIERGNRYPSVLFTGKAPKVRLVTESGLYKLVLRSDKPEAKEFQHWVTSVVLPAIRKDGAYIEGEEKVASPVSFGRPQSPLQCLPGRSGQ